MYPMSYRPPADREIFLAAPWLDDDDYGQATESMDCSSGVINLYAPEHDLGELNARANSGLISPRLGVIPFCPDENFSGRNSGLMSPRSGGIPPLTVEENCWGDVVDTRTDMLFDITPIESLEARNNSNLMDPNPILFGCNVTENNLDLLFSTTTTLNQMLENDSKFPPEEPAPKRENLPISNENESLVNLFDQFQHGLKVNAMIVHNDDYYNSPEMQVVDQEKICPRILPTGPPTGPPTKPYTPFTDHNYTELMFNPLVPIKIEVKDECSSDVDVWNDPGQPSPPIAESDPPSPLPYKRTRRSKAKAPQQVSINRAAKTAKRQRSTSSMTTRKHQKVGNSLETSPSGSDSEDPKSPMPPPRRVPAKRGKKTTSAKPTKSEVQRNTHNMNEKMRRTQMTRELNEVRNLIPQFIYDKEKCSKSKASKQKVLNAARRFVDYLKEESGAVTSQEYLYHNLKEELSITQAKLDKILKKFMDKYYKVKGYHYKTRR